MAEVSDNKRRSDRQPVLKSAKVHFDQSVVDCLVLDFSSSGMRVSTEVPIEFPKIVTIELRTGAMWQAARRWQRGLETGFELLQFAGLNIEASARALEIYSKLRDSIISEATERLVREGYFDSPALRGATVALARAYDQLTDAFRDVLNIR